MDWTSFKTTLSIIFWIESRTKLPYRLFCKTSLFETSLPIIVWAFITHYWSFIDPQMLLQDFFNAHSGTLRCHHVIERQIWTPRIKILNRKTHNKKLLGQNSSWTVLILNWILYFHSSQHNITVDLNESLILFSLHNRSLFKITKYKQLSVHI